MKHRHGLVFQIVWLCNQYLVDLLMWKRSNLTYSYTIQDLPIYNGRNREVSDFNPVNIQFWALLMLTNPVPN